MTKDFVLAAQLSTGHSPRPQLTNERVLPQLERALDAVSLDILIVGWEEIPDLYRILTDEATRRVPEVYCWYPLLSDYPEMEPEHLMVNYQGKTSQGWGEFAAGGEINETFRFSCPNNPQARKTTLTQLEYLLATYNFDGVFLDKFRFPSPANGLQEMLSCFCPHCYREARAWGLDLDDVKAALTEIEKGAQADARREIEVAGADWLADLLAGRPVLHAFLRFRCDIITELVDDVRALTKGLGKEVALDIFAPGLAPLVGQDYTTLGERCVWVKPMIYRRARGPAGFPLEIPLLIRDLARFLDVSKDEAMSWVQAHAPGLGTTDLGQIERDGSPLALIAAEAQTAVNLLDPIPVYMGLETVSMPGIIEITPEGVQQVVTVGHEAGIAGVVLSWDLLHTPFENLRALEAIV